VSDVVARRVVAVMCSDRAVAETGEMDGSVEEVEVAGVDDLAIGDVVLVRDGIAFARAD
jgi:hypothetical protein